MLEYFLHADLLVKEENAEQFEELCGAFMRGKGPGREAWKRLNPNFDNSLVFSLRTPQPFTYTGLRKNDIADFHGRDKRVLEAGQRVINYVNLWKVRDLHDLDIASMMLRSADDDLYARLNGLVVREIQNYIIRVRWLGSQPVGQPQNAMVRVQRQFKSRDMGAYLGAAGAVFPLLEQLGWRSWGFFQNVTGILNTVTEFWERTDSEKYLPLNDALTETLSRLERLQPSFGNELMEISLPLQVLNFTTDNQSAFATAVRAN